MAVKNVGGFTHPDILAEKTLVDADNNYFYSAQLTLLCGFMVITLYAFSIESMHGSWLPRIQLVWDTPFVGEDLLCEREVNNPHNMHAVPGSELTRLLTVTLTVVEHVPRRISSVC